MGRVLLFSIGTEREREKERRRTGRKGSGLERQSEGFENV